MKKDLEALEGRWGLAVQSAAFGVWDLDVCAQTVHYSPQWKAMLGYHDADEPDATAVWRDRVHPEDLDGMVQALGAHLDGQTPSYEREFRLRTADGLWCWVLSRGRVVQRDAEGRALRAVGTLTDLSDRREAERMRLERDRAEAAHRAQTEFLSRMSHELRTPLNAVLGFAQIMAQRAGTAEPSEQRHHLALIERAGWDLLRMIDNMLETAVKRPLISTPRASEPAPSLSSLAPPASAQTSLPAGIPTAGPRITASGSPSVPGRL